MASAANEVVVRTITTNVLNADEKPWPISFRRIIGIEAVGGLVACRGIDEATLAAANREVLRLRDAGQIERLCAYFAQVIALNDTRLRGSTVRLEADYNCHSAAEFIAGSGKLMLGRQAVNFVRSTYLRRGMHVAVDPPYALGAMGFVMGHDREEQSHGMDVRHSFISLGSDSSECLAVLRIGGPLAIIGYGETWLNEWGWGRPEDDELGEELSPYFATTVTE